MDLKDNRDYQPIKDTEDLTERLEHYSITMAPPHKHTRPASVDHPIILLKIIVFLKDKIESLEKEVTELKRR